MANVNMEIESAVEAKNQPPTCNYIFRHALYLSGDNLDNLAPGLFYLKYIKPVVTAPFVVKCAKGYLVKGSTNDLEKLMMNENLKIHVMPRTTKILVKGVTATLSHETVLADAKRIWPTTVKIRRLGAGSIVE